jgi:hypothetical protein
MRKAAQSSRSARRGWRGLALVAATAALAGTVGAGPASAGTFTNGSLVECTASSTGTISLSSVCTGGGYVPQGVRWQ